MRRIFVKYYGAVAAIGGIQGYVYPSFFNPRTCNKKKQHASHDVGSVIVITLNMAHYRTILLKSPMKRSPKSPPGSDFWPVLMGKVEVVGWLRAPLRRIFVKYYGAVAAIGGIQGYVYPSFFNPRTCNKKQHASHDVASVIAITSIMSLPNNSLSNPQ